MALIPILIAAPFLIASGYFLGRTSIQTATQADRATASKPAQHPSQTQRAGSESSDEDEQDGSALASFPDHANEECKMVLVVRTDLGMSSGKIAAQCSHATLACYKAFLRKAPESPVLRRWERLGQAKITLQVKSEEDLQMLQAQAISLGMAAEIIHDAGRTEIASGTATVLGIGPAPKSVVDQVTGQLRLLR